MVVLGLLSWSLSLPKRWTMSTFSWSLALIREWQLHRCQQLCIWCPHPPALEFHGASGSNLRWYLAASFTFCSSSATFFSFSWQITSTFFMSLLRVVTSKIKSDFLMASIYRILPNHDLQAICPFIHLCCQKHNNIVLHLKKWHTLLASSFSPGAWLGCQGRKLRTGGAQVVSIVVRAHHIFITHCSISPHSYIPKRRTQNHTLLWLIVHLTISPFLSFWFWSWKFPCTFDKLVFELASLSGHLVLSHT